MKKLIIFIFMCMFSMALIAAEDKTAEKVAAKEVKSEEVKSEETEPELKFEDITFPPKEDPEYWVIRSEAMHEVTPFLTKKRAEMKDKRKFLAEYLLKIDKAEEMVALANKHKISIIAMKDDAFDPA